jgi:hypothetical protein
MNDTIMEAGKQMPALVALVFLVLSGLREMRMISTSFISEITAAETRREGAIKSMALECHTVQRDSIAAMSEVTKHLAQNTEAFRATGELLKRINEDQRRGTA